MEWVAIPFSRGSSEPRDQTSVSCIERQVLHHQRHLESPCKAIMNVKGADGCNSTWHKVCIYLIFNQKLNQYLSKVHLKDLTKYSRKINNRVFV